MSATEQDVAQFLADLKADGRSSPAGAAWMDFHQFLHSRRQNGGDAPPMPFILAASGESNEAKHRRLSDQLLWAHRNGCLREALGHLRAIPPDRWNSGPASEWDRDSYWQP